MRLSTTPTVLRRGPGARQIGTDPGRSLGFTGLEELDALGLDELGRRSEGRGHELPFLPGRVRTRLLAAGLLAAPLPRLRIRLVQPSVLTLRIVEACAAHFEICLEIAGQTTSKPLAEELGDEWLAAPLSSALARRFGRIGAPVLLEKVPIPDCVLVNAERGHEPEETRTLLIEDIPHLLLTRLEEGYEVGPLVLPGYSACAGCVSIEREEKDPFWSAALLCAPRIEEPMPTAASRSPRMPRHALEVATLLGLDALAPIAHQHRRATRVFPEISWLDPYDSRAGTIVRVFNDGSKSVEYVWPRPECGCGAAGDLGPARKIPARKGPARRPFSGANS